MKGVTDFCNAKGWECQPQAPQMLHSNTCDLAIFPVMSRRHAAALRKKSDGVRVMKEDTIWETAKEVWTDMESCTISRSFVLAHRICKKVVEHNGDNIYLTGTKGGLHSDVRKDFMILILE